MYQAEYQRKLVTPQAAAERIPENAVLLHGLAMAEPPALLRAVADRLYAGDLKRLRVFSLLPQVHACETVLHPGLCDQVEATTWFVSGGDRGLVHVGLQSFWPNHFHQVPRLIRDHVDVDVMVTMVSPMDASGHFSLGTSNDYSSTAARKARRLIVEVNENMPRVFGESLLHISEVDAIVENHAPLPPMPAAEPHPVDRVISQTIAEMVPDGATIQLGFGSLPGAVGEALEGHKDLGIHTEVFGPAMVHLIKKGVATGRQKTLHPRLHVYTVAQGDKEMLEFINDNPAMASYPVSYTNHPAVIAQNHKMVSINSTLEMDLLGQCNSEFMAGAQFSGTGGQLDFVRGAYDSPGGLSILAFRSTAKDGTISRIVPRLAEGVMVTTPRMDTHWVVTEHGKANLKGLSSRQRVLALVGLAAPEYRDGLLKEAEQMGLL